MRQKKTIRYATSAKLLGLPLLVIACGPDASKGETRGWARGIIAIGDVATGLIAIGGLAGGGIAVGGLSLGALGVGGVSLGGIILGGVAIGYLAFGGVAIGHYAKGGAAVGTYVINSERSDPESVRVFNSLIPGISQPLKDEISKLVIDKGVAPEVEVNSAPAEASENVNP
jgi:hypothetical protein